MDEHDGHDDDDAVDQLDEWKKRQTEGEQSARELFQDISKIAVLLSYDMIDKLRYWEKETLKLSDEEIDERLKHMSEFLEELKSAYVKFSEVDF